MTEMTPREAGRLLRRFNAGEVAARTADLVRPGIVEAMRRRAPVGRDRPKQGRRLVDSIFAERHTRPGGSTLNVVTSAPHARFVLEGTAAHRIPRSGDADPVLSFFWRSGTAAWMSYRGSTVTDARAANARVFFAHVNHPGTKPNRFNEKAWEDVRVSVTRVLREQVSEAFAAGKRL